MFARPENTVGSDLVDAVFETTSLDIFQRLYPWVIKGFYGAAQERLMNSVARRGTVPILD